MFRALGILITGYGFAAASAIALFVAGGSLVAATLTFWLGGAVAVCAIAIVKAPQWADEPEVDEAESEQVLRDALRRWEADRLEDRRIPLRQTGTD
jgi:hypothetical protein